MRKACTKGESLVLRTTEKVFESTRVIQSTYPETWYGANWSTVSPKKPPKASILPRQENEKDLSDMYRGKVPLTYFRHLFFSCFSRAVYGEQCLFSDDECLWHKSLTSEPSLIQKVKDRALLPAPRHFMSSSTGSVMSHVWSLEGVAPWA